jgi:two-component system, LuxR family, response regulator FixJ
MGMAETGIVFLVDDDALMCQTIKAALQRAGLKVRTFSSIHAFGGMNICSECGGLPCCLVMEMAVGELSGLDFLEKRFSGRTPCPVIMITARPSIQDTVKSMKLGAVDVIEKPFATETLTAAVLETLRTHKCSSAARLEREAVRVRIATLSPRERELLDAIVLGSSTKMIADRLGISARTVDHHRANLMEKMRAANVADLVRMAMQADYRNVAPESRV